MKYDLKDDRPLIRRLPAYPIYVLLFPVFVVLNIENNYHRLIEYRFVTGEILLLVLLPLLGYLAASALLRSWRLGALFSFPAYAVFYFGGTFKNALDRWTTSALSSFYLFLPLVLLALVAWFAWLRRRKPQGRRAMWYFNGLLLVYVLIECGRLVGATPTANDFADPRKQKTAAYQPCSSCPHPDIYYIIFDGYSSSPVLRELGLDNAPTDSFLRAAGFYVASGSISNYNFTAFSMGSVFNLDYLHGIDTTRTYFDNEYLPAVYTVFRSEWWPMLQREGYRGYNLSNFPMAGLPSALTPFDIWFQNHLYKPYNFVDYVNRSVGWHLPRALRFRSSTTDDDFAKGRHRQLLELPGKLQEAVRDNRPGPKFVYAHYLLPHGPYSYDSTGRFGPGDPEEQRGYLAQLRYANRLLREAVTLVQRQQPAGRPYLLLLQGDHGLRFTEKTERPRSFRNLNAFYFYDRNYRLLTPDVSNVNTFRIVANTYFGKQYPLLPGRTFYLKTGRDED